MKQSGKIIIGILIIVAAIGYLIISGTSSFSGYQVEISDLFDSEKDYKDDYLLVPGKLVGDSVNFDGENVQLTFSVTDGKYELPVIYNDIEPDNFQDGAEVFLEGFYDKENNIFKAERVTTKCPSKYEGEKALAE
ncbi:MAG: cytochrome c-type biosis protein CcmE [Clostridia bacterium]|jgi:cytochrome c-type biogenesis protein CcmE|nr:hypothetical protein [Clostridiales bacterium]MDK2986323.1 cytochrome c-type biosis protein CcmE [Clostridia bacterium]